MFFFSSTSFLGEFASFSYLEWFKDFTGMVNGGCMEFDFIDSSKLPKVILAWWRIKSENESLRCGPGGFWFWLKTGDTQLSAVSVTPQTISQRSSILVGRRWNFMTLNVETCPTHEVSSWSAYVSMCMRIASIVDEYIALLYTDNPIPNSTNKNHGTNPKFFYGFRLQNSEVLWPCVPLCLPIISSASIPGSAWKMVLGGSWSLGRANAGGKHTYHPCLNVWYIYLHEWLIFMGFIVSWFM